MTRKEIKNTIYEIAFEHIGDYLKNILYKSSNDGEDLFVYEELGFDSLDTITFIMNIEDKFKIDLPDTLFTKGVTLRTIIDYIYDEQGKNL